MGKKRMRNVSAIVVVAVTSLALVGALTTAGSAPAGAVPETPPEPAPPEGQTYVGAKRCASCHFEQYMKWQKTNHSESFALLPAKYEKDPKCLKCHTTGYGEPSGYKDSSDTALKGTTCEACHGPGSKHEEACKPLAKVKQLNPEQEKLAKDSIWLMLPRNVCIECHKVQAHGESSTSKELIKKK